MVGWFGSGTDPFISARTRQRAISNWRILLEEGKSIVFIPTNGSPLAAQTLRVESDNRASPLIGESGTAPIRQVTLFGIRNHPTVADTIVKEGYTFNLGEGSDKDKYKVIDIVYESFEVQILCQATR